MSTPPQDRDDILARLRESEARHEALVEEQRRSEADLRRARAFLEGIALGTEDIIAAQDLDFRYTFFNEAYRHEFAKLWGGHLLEPGDDMVALLAPWPEERDKARELWARAAGGESFRITMAFGPTPEEQQVYDLRFNPVRDAEGGIIGAAHIFRNVTDQVRAEEELREAKRRAEEASTTKSQFLATMSHELRTPLAGIIGYADLLESEVLGPTNPRQRETLARMKAGAWHLVSIIDEVLTLSRAEAGKEEVNLQPTDVAAIARDVVQIVEPQARSAGLVLNAVGVGEAAILTTDAGKVRQVLVNLVGNAAKYTHEGEIQVRLERDGTGGVRVHVQDTGPGIGEADRERIFEPFTQADSSHRREKSGTGLGLAIALRMARLLGGDLTLRSTVGKGSTFTLVLPPHPPGQEPPAGPEAGAGVVEA